MSRPGDVRAFGCRCDKGGSLLTRALATSLSSFEGGVDGVAMGMGMGTGFAFVPPTLNKEFA